MTMTLPYQEPLVPREPAERQIPEPPRRGEPGGPPCSICAGSTTSAVWSDENWTLHPPRRREPAGGRLARQPRPRRLVCRSARRRGSRLRPGRGAGRAGDPLPGRRLPRPPLSVGRRRGPLPRVVPAAAAGDGRGVGDDAPALGGRPAERARRGARRRSPADRRRDVTQAQALARRLGTGDAVVIGLGSMIGAGVFSAFAPAARAAGSALLVGLGDRGGGRLLQRDRLGPARRAVSDLRRDVRLRPRAARGVVGIHRRLGLRGRQDSVVRSDGADLRVLRRQRLRMGRAPGRASPRWSR